MNVYDLSLAVISLEMPCLKIANTYCTVYFIINSGELPGGAGAALHFCRGQHSVGAGEGSLNIRLIHRLQVSQKTL